MYAQAPLVADQGGVNYRKAGITTRQKVMLAFALKDSDKSGEIDDADCGKTAAGVQARQPYGYEVQPHEVAAVAAYHGLMQASRRGGGVVVRRRGGVSPHCAGDTGAPAWTQVVHDDRSCSTSAGQ